MINFGLYAVAIAPPVEIKILGNKLRGLFILTYNFCLPGQVLGNQQALKLGKLPAGLRPYYK